MAGEKIPVEKSSAGEMEEKTMTKKKESQVDFSKKENHSVESVYTAKELSDHAKVLFHTRKECVMAALKEAGISVCTVSHAKNILKTFMKKEVV